MRFFTLSIAVLALLAVVYVSFKTPSEAAVFGDDAVVAQLDPGHAAAHR